MRAYGIARRKFSQVLIRIVQEEVSAGGYEPLRKILNVRAYACYRLKSALGSRRAARVYVQTGTQQTPAEDPGSPLVAIAKSILDAESYDQSRDSGTTYELRVTF